MKNIRQKAFDPQRLRLSPEEGFVLSRVDGRATVKDLVSLTGLPEDRILGILGKLETEGAIATGEDATSTVDAELRAFLDSEEVPVVPLEPASEGAGTDEPEPTDDPEPEPEPESTDEPTDDPETVERDRRNQRAYRQIYETVYHPMPRDQRLKVAAEVTGSDLLALCLDPDPQIIHAILGNPHAILDHVRMIAQHHHTQVGLEAVARRVDHLSDRIVQRHLLRNPQLPGTILNRLVNPKLILDVYKLGIDREIPERSRVMTREMLRKKFMLSSADEKAALLFKTEGRCLLLLVNCSLDAHATQILCAKSTYTLLFVQNLARWSATPPALLAHLLKQQAVRRNAGLKKLLLKHPNMPSDAKRNTT